MQSNHQIQPWQPPPLPEHIEPMVWFEQSLAQPLAQRHQPVTVKPVSLNPLVMAASLFLACLGLATLLAGVGAFIEGVHPAQFRTQQGVPTNAE